MSLIKEVAGELAGMFIGDGRLTLAILAVIGGAAVVIGWSGLDPLVGGAALLAGSLLVLIENVGRSARPKARP
jgi:hypothetical protein